jgi:hypothetical protein
MKLCVVLLLAATIATSSACGSPRPPGRRPKPDAQTAVPKVVNELQAKTEPVRFDVLQSQLPSDDYLKAEGWQKSDMTGFMLAEPMKGAQASITLKKAGTQVVINIIDTVFSQSLFAPIATFLADGYSEKDDNGFKTGIKIQGFPAFEEWTRQDRSAGLTVLVGQRFLVHLQGTAMNSTDPLKALASQINMVRLSALK